MFSLQNCSIEQSITAQKINFSIKEFFSKYDQIRKKLMENFILCAVHYAVSNENSISCIAIGFKLKLRFDTIFLVKITSENMTLT